MDDLDFVVERVEGEEWELAEDDRQAIARHRADDLPDALPLDEVRDAVLGGRPDDV